MKTTTPCTGGSTVSTYAFYESSRTQRRHARNQMATGASSATSSCGGAVRSSRGRRLQQEIEAGKRGIRCGSSQRSRREAQTARGGVRDGVQSPAISVQRRRGRARWRGSTASGDAWLVEEEEGGRGGASWRVGKAWSGRWPRWQRVRRRWRSVAACERNKGGERRSGQARGGRGGAWRLQPAPSVGGSRRWLGRVPARGGHVPLVLLARGGR